MCAYANTWIRLMIRMMQAKAGVNTCVYIYIYICTICLMPCLAAGLSFQVWESSLAQKLKNKSRIEDPVLSFRHL